MSKSIVAPALGLVDKVLADVFDVHGRYTPLLERVGDLGKTYFPEEWIKPFIEHYQLGRVEAYLPFNLDPKTAFQEGLAWQGERGWLSSWERAFSWIGITARFEEGVAPLWPDCLQVHVSEPVGGAVLDAVIDLGYASKRSLDIYHRIICNYDLRPVVAGFSQFGASKFGAFSGVRRNPGEPLLSMRHRADFVTPPAPSFVSDEGVVVEEVYRDYNPITYGVHAFGIYVERKVREEVSLATEVFNDEYSNPPESYIRPTEKSSYPQAAIEEEFIPLAAVVPGRSKFADRQSVFLATKREAGTSPIFGASKFADKQTPERLVRIFSVPAPISSDFVAPDPIDPLDHLEAFEFVGMAAPILPPQYAEDLADDATLVFNGQPPGAEVPSFEWVSGEFVAPLTFDQVATEAYLDALVSPQISIPPISEELAEQFAVSSDEFSGPWSLLPWSDAVEFGLLPDGISQTQTNED